MNSTLGHTFEDMEQFERLLEPYLQRLAAMVSLVVDIQCTENWLSGSILILGMKFFVLFITKNVKILF